MEPYSIAGSPYGQAILSVQAAALSAVEPGAAVRQKLRRDGDQLTIADESLDLAEVDRILVVGGGKAASAMAGAVYAVMGDYLTGGLVVTKYGHKDPGLDTGPVQVVEAGHPVPDAAGVAATRRMLDQLAGLSPRDLVIAVISGGGSALLALPAPGLSLSDLQRTTDLLLRSGAPIGEQNTVRKHLSAVKGGELARRAAPAMLTSLVLSDVVGDPLDVIASGPTVPDPTTFGEAWSILKRRDLLGRVPTPVRTRIRSGAEGGLPESPKPGDPIFLDVRNLIIGSNRLAAEAAAEEAQAQGWNAFLLSTFVEGEAREVGQVAAALLKELVHYDRPAARPACLVWGGETTVTVRGRGRGGRNQELALAAAVQMEGLPDVVLVALGTDGTDGPTDAAGAVATGDTVARARSRGRDPLVHLEDNDSYPFFAALDDLIRTGPTGTNVNDLLLLFAF